MRWLLARVVAVPVQHDGNNAVAQFNYLVVESVLP
jgi:hypothetical protein